MPVGASPDGENPAQTPRKVIPGMRIDRLHLTQRHPHQYRHQMHIASEISQNKRRPNGPEPEQQRLPGTRVFRRQAERRGVLVVHAMDAAIQRAPVEGAVQPVVVCVFDEEEHEELGGEGLCGGEGEAVLQAAEVHHRVEEDDQGELDDEVDGQDVFDAGPLVCG